MKRITDNILFILVLVALAIFMCFIVNVFACSGDECKSDGNVMYSGEGNKGYIFVYDCQKNDKSNTDIGNWVDPITIPSLKGDTGATGLQGLQGIQGIQGLKGNTGLQGLKGDKGDTGLAGKDGLNGLNGLNGQDGLNGINGIDGQNGLDGLNGVKGDTGDAGIQGNKGDLGDKGDKGKEGYTPIKNIDYFDGLNGLNGLNGKDVDPKEVKRLDNKNLEQDNRINDLDNRVGKLERTQYVLETSFRIVDTKRISLRPFFRQNFTRNKVDIVGLKIDVKLGQSYEEKLIKKVNARLDLLEQIIGNAPVIEKVVDKKGNVKSISIVGNGLRVDGKF